MESAGSPCEKKACLGLNSTILRPSPAFARKLRTSNEVLFGPAIDWSPSRSAVYGDSLLIRLVVAKRPIKIIALAGHSEPRRSKTAKVGPLDEQVGECILLV